MHYTSSVFPQVDVLGFVLKMCPLLPSLDFEKAEVNTDMPSVVFADV